jgi:hypothetical protein
VDDRFKVRRQLTDDLEAMTELPLNFELDAALAKFCQTCLAIGGNPLNEASQGLLGQSIIYLAGACVDMASAAKFQH